MQADVSSKGSIFAFLLLIAALSAPFGPAAHGDSAAAAERRDASILLPPPGAKLLALYDRPFATLSDPEQWRIRIFGLRMAALDPRVWGSLRREKTINRHLVPIKRYFLRASEEPGFELKSIRMRFRFKNADPAYMRKMRHQKDPVLDVGVGGRFRETGIAEPPVEDSGYVVRLSAFPGVASGIFRRESESFTRLVPAPNELEVGTFYDVEIRASRASLDVSVNGTNAGHLRLEGVSKGLVSLQTSWHPIVLESLRIVGTQMQADGPVETEFSGMIDQGTRT